MGPNLLNFHDYASGTLARRPNLGTISMAEIGLRALSAPAPHV
jgi:hypothetical protein